jgi:hemoglobin
MSDSQASIYEQIGEEGFRRLVAAFYRRVANDPILRPLYPDEDLSGAETRLRLFLIQFWGGPQTYNQQRGHPRLRIRHMPFRIDQAGRDAWVAAMLAGLDEADIPEPAYSQMRRYFEEGATFLINAAPAQDHIEQRP